jgi:hypothetical protein
MCFARILPLAKCNSPSCELGWYAWIAEEDSRSVSDPDRGRSTSEGSEARLRDRPDEEGEDGEDTGEDTTLLDSAGDASRVISVSLLSACALT